MPKLTTKIRFESDPNLRLSILQEGNANLITVDKLNTVPSVLQILKSFDVEYAVFGSSIYMNAANRLVMKAVGSALESSGLSYVYFHVSNPIGSELRSKNVDRPLVEHIIEILLTNEP